MFATYLIIPLTVYAYVLYVPLCHKLTGIHFYVSVVSKGISIFVNRFLLNVNIVIVLYIY